MTHVLRFDDGTSRPGGWSARSWAHDTMTTRRDQPFPPFDVETEADVTQQFWGSSRGWVSHGAAGVSATDPFDEPTPDAWSDDSTGALRAIRDGVRAFRPQRVPRSNPTGQVARTRQHGAVHSPQAPAPGRPSAVEASLGELASGWTDDSDAFDPRPSTGMNRHTGEPTERLTAFDEGDLVPLSSTSPLSERIGLGAVDPLLLRMGMLMLVGLLLIPLALALRPASNDVLEGAPLAASLSPMVADGVDSIGNQVAASDPTAPASTSAASGQISSAGTTEAVAAAGTEPVSDPAGDVASASVGTVATVADVAQSQQNAIAGAAGVSAVAEREVPACPSTYVAGPGDSWYRIAAAADITPTALFAENGANADTVIFAGDSICLPAGATMPSPPPTPTPTTTPPSTAPTTEPPSTTEAPSTTTTQPAAPPASQAEVQQIIRDVWPDELEERALEIALRESNYIATAHNGTCCYGVFQLYWSVHWSWLDDFGIYTATDLFDADKNVRAAYGLYQRSGGWGPWGG
jgi:LysM repeat protein